MFYKVLCWAVAIGCCLLAAFHAEYNIPSHMLFLLGVPVGVTAMAMLGEARFKRGYHTALTHVDDMILEGYPPRVACEKLRKAMEKDE